MNSEETQEIPWYEKWFDREEYEMVYRERDEDDAAKLIDLIEAVVQPEDGAAVLDVACGRGRHARLLARRGYHVTGLDLSEQAIRTARRRAAEAGLDITFVQRDMREPIGQPVFDGAVNLFTSFGYFEDESDHERAIRSVANVLNPDGWFVQDFLNAPHARNTLVPRDTRTEDELRIDQKRWIAGGRLNKQITLKKNGKTRTFQESVRLLTLDDFRRMYAAAGLEMFDIRGDYGGSSYGPETERLIMFSRKAQ